MVDELVPPPGPPSIENGAHGTEKPLLKTQISEPFHRGRQALQMVHMAPKSLC